MALHAPDDRLADALAVVRDGGGVESFAAVADEHLQAAGLGLGVERDRAGVGRELRRVRERLARGGDHRLGGGVQLGVAHLDDLDRDAVRVLDLLGRRPDRARERGLAARALLEQPRAQLAFLAAGQRGDLARVVGALLHQGEGLKDRVVKVGRQLGPLLRADALGALGRQVAAHPPEERGQDQREGQDGNDRGEGRVAHPAQGIVRRQEEQGRPDHQRDAEAALVEVGDHSRPARGGRRGGGLDDVGVGQGAGLAPEHGGAARGQHQRPDQGVAPPDAELAEGEERREREQGGAGRDPPAGVGEGADALAAGRCGRGALRGDDRPGQRVGQEDQPAGEEDGDHEQDPDQQRVGAEAQRQAREDAGHDAGVRVAAERSRLCNRVHGDMVTRRPLTAGRGPA